MPQCTEAQLNASKDNEIHNIVNLIASKAKFFAKSWDQPASPTAAETLLDNIAKVYHLSISPQHFADNMYKVVGQ